MNKKLIYALFFMRCVGFYSQAMDSSAAYHASNSQSNSQLTIELSSNAQAEEVPDAQAAVAQQLLVANNAQPAQANFWRRHRTNISYASMILCACAGAVMLGATAKVLLEVRKQCDIDLGHFCAKDDTDMTNQCFAVQVTNCGKRCILNTASTRCALPGVITTLDIKSKLKSGLNTTCDGNTGYCIIHQACSMGGFTCYPDNLTGFIKELQDECGSSHKKHHPSIKSRLKAQKAIFKNNSQLHPKSKAWDKRRAPHKKYS